MKTKTKQVIVITAVAAIALSSGFALGVLRGVRFADEDRHLAHSTTAAMQFAALSALRAGNNVEAIQHIENIYNFNRGIADSKLTDQPLSALRYIITHKLDRRTPYLDEQKTALLAYIDANPDTRLKRP